jgi:uncharacterized protein (TIGR00369 family)
MNPEMLRKICEDLIPFNKLLGVRMLMVERGRVLLEIPFREELVGDPLKRALHGGVLSALADTAGGLVIWSVLESSEQRLSTIDLRVDYLRPGSPETVVAEAIVLRAGRTVGVADIRMFHHRAPADTVATGRGVYGVRTPRSAVASR